MLSGNTLFYPGIYLTGRQLSTNTAVPISQQGMSGVCAGEYEWYGNGQLFWPVTARGKQANFLIEIPESGTYDLAASFTTAPGYGTFRISIDGEAIGKPTDLYGTIAQKNLTLGAVNLTAGTHILTIECTGKNAASSAHALGLNYLKFEPHTDRPQTASVYLKGSSDLLRAVTDCTTEGRPHDQGLDPAISDDGSHLFWVPSEGGTFTFKVSTPMSGLYTIETGYTCYRDFGKFALYLDGVQIGEIYDAYDTELKVKKAVIENVPVTEGDHCITVKCVGKNDASSDIVFGMDYFKMAGESAALPLTVLAAAFYGGSRDLLRVLQTYTSSEVPYDQGLDPAISDDGSHLFWRSAVGDTADFRIDLPIDAVYTLTAAYTCAGDFAQFEWLLDGEKLGETYDAYAAGVAVKTLTTEAIKLGAGRTR